MLWGTYSAIYGEVNVSVENCVEIKGDYVEKQQSCFYFCHLKKLVRPETFGPYYVCCESYYLKQEERKSVFLAMCIFFREGSRVSTDKENAGQ